MMEDFEKNIQNPPSQDREIILTGGMETDEEMWKKLRNEVERNYMDKEVDPELIREFVRHNLQVEDFARRFSEAEGFNDKEKEIVIIGAILHDIAKGYGEFLEHGEEGGRLAKKILLESGVSEDLAESVRLGIVRHMGQEGYPAELARHKFGENFVYPQVSTKVGDMLYRCDILTQLTREGIDKIISLRKTDLDNVREDERVAAEKGISVGEARFLSAIESAKKSYDIIMKDSDLPLESVKEYARKIWEHIPKDYKDYAAYEV